MSNIKNGISGNFVKIIFTLDIVIIRIYTIDTVNDMEVSFLDILISNTSPLPLYEQIEKQIKEQILSGAIVQGEALPSIRTLAKDLRVSVITAKRAYDDLEGEGFLQTVAGKGTFVGAISFERLREMALAQVEERLWEALQLAKNSGIAKEELIAILNLLYEEEE